MPYSYRTSCLLPSLCFAVLLAVPAYAANWPAWRGPHANGHSDEKNFPLNWNNTENIAWKVPLPGPGNSTPIIWGSKVFITQATEKGAKRSVLCFDRADGKKLWESTVEFKGVEPTHGDNPHCAATPVTDGERVVAWHGSAGLFAYDLDGKELWRREDLGVFTHIWGNASSPQIWKDCVITYMGPGLRTFLLCVDKSTGKDLWRKELPEAQAKTPDQYFGSWSTPYLRDGGTGGDSAELLVGLPKKLVALDPRTGNERWFCEGAGPLVYTNALADGNTAVLMSGYSGPAFACKLGGTGNVTATHRLWLHDQKKDLPQRVGSGILVGEHLYILNDPGFAQCIEIKTGREVWRDTLGKSWSSMVCADGKLYIIDMKGESFVLNATPEFKLLARNPLNERTRASLALSDGQIFIRTYQHLYCVGKK